MTTELAPKQQEEAREIVTECLAPGQPAQRSVLVSRIASALASRDQEIRVVLEGLITHVFGEEDIGPIPHWCPVDEDFDSQCNPTCLAARALWERVLQGGVKHNPPPS